jgi:hypothetical protein
VRAITRALAVTAIGAMTGLTPAVAEAQSNPKPGKGFYAGGSLGVYFESSEGHHGSAAAGSGSLGYAFNDRWAVQLELGQTGTAYCYQESAVFGPSGNRTFVYPDVSKKNPPQGSICHSDPIANLDVVRRFTSFDVRPYLALGIGAGFHLGVGVAIPLGARLTLSPGVDFNAGPEFGGARPRMALLVRF